MKKMNIELVWQVPKKLTRNKHAGLGYMDVHPVLC
jgi:hypothetical protein